MKLNDIFIPEQIDDEDVNYIPIVVNQESDDKVTKTPDQLPLLPLRNAVLFTRTVIPITISREKSIKLIRDVYNSSKLLGVSTQKDSKTDNPGRHPIPNEDCR